MSETGINQLKREVLVRMIRAFDTDDFPENVRRIPYEMRPKGHKAPYRCCVYKEREILRSRIIAGLGTSVEQDDEMTSTADYAKRACQRIRPEEAPLTVVENACQGCAGSHMYVTDLCQNCVARSCINSCPFGAIRNNGGRAVIDVDKCKQCGLCAKACSYHAIAKTVVPCENACPVGAISKDERGFAHIDFDKCITCGKCVAACPFGAVHPKSQLIDVLQKMKIREPVVALVAPAVMGQFTGTPEQVHTALKKAGFSHVMEVAVGADITIKNEAKELKERLDKGQAFMTTSCCAAYNELIQKHIPDLKRFESDTKTPLYYTLEVAAKKYPGATLVFISPCFAKIKEIAQQDAVSYLMSVMELEALFEARGIVVDKLEATPFQEVSSQGGKNFGMSSGVASAVKHLAGDIKTDCINGLTKEAIQRLKKCAKDGVCPEAELLEVMACEGGCVGGNGTIRPCAKAIKAIKEYSAKSGEITQD